MLPKFNSKNINSPLESQAKKRPNAIFIASDKIAISYVQAYFVQQLITYKLRSLISQNNKLIIKSKVLFPPIVLLSNNNLLLILIILAGWESGIPIALINPRLNNDEIKYRCQLLSHPIIIKIVDSSSKKKDLSINHLLWDENLLEKMLKKKKTFKKNNFVKNFFSNKKKWNLNNTASWLFTSGTSGNAKAVGHLLSAHYYSAKGSKKIINLSKQDVWQMSLQCHHVGGYAIIMRCLLSGAKLLLPSNTVKSHYIYRETTHISWVSAQLQAYLAQNNKNNNRLKTVLLGGGPTSESLIKAGLAKNLPLYLSYGSTETASQVYTEKLIWHHQKNIILKKGKILPYRYLKIDKTGEILWSGKTLFSALRKGRDKKSITINQNISHYSSGDLGLWKKDKGRKKSLEIIGRKDDMFISGGEKIHPQWLENKIREIENVCDKVDNVVVIPYPDEKYGKVPCVFVLVKKAKNILKQKLLNEKDLWQAVVDEICQVQKDKWPYYMKIRYFYRWPNDIVSQIKISRKIFSELIKTKKPDWSESVSAK